MHWFEFRQRPPAYRAGEALNTPAGAPLPRAVMVDGRAVTFQRIPGYGSAPRRTLVLLHGMGLTGASFQPVSPWLLPTHDLLLIDYNSFAAPETWPAGGVSLRMMAAGVGAVVDALRLTDYAMAGSSLGGGLAVMHTLYYPVRPTHMILINPAVYPQELPLVYRLWRWPVLGELLMKITPAEKLIAGVAFLGYSSPERMDQGVRWAYERNMAAYARRLELLDVVRQLPCNRREMIHVASLLPTIRVPTLVVWGRQEILLLPDAGDRLARDLPQGRLLAYDDLAHLPHEEAPERVGPELARFLNAPAEAPA